MSVPSFQKMILAWYAQNKRDHLPWRQQEALCDPYKILVSEIMLQQTQVTRVLEKYPQFLEMFPSLPVLARAPFPRVLQAWQGMGYNRRARSLHMLAGRIASEYKGIIPSDAGALMELPGIGPYTAGAMACFAFGKPVVFLDTNIRKVYLHHFFSGTNDKVADKELLKVADAALYRENPRTWHYALMDYGAMALRKEKGILGKAKQYHRQSPFEGSTRYFRSKIVRHLLTYQKATEKELGQKFLCDRFFSPAINLPSVLLSLEHDGIIQHENDYYVITG